MFVAQTTKRNFLIFLQQKSKRMYTIKIDGKTNYLFWEIQKQTPRVMLLEWEGRVEKWSKSFLSSDSSSHRGDM